MSASASPHLRDEIAPWLLSNVFLARVGSVSDSWFSLISGTQFFAITERSIVAVEGPNTTQGLIQRGEDQYRQSVHVLKALW